MVNVELVEMRYADEIVQTIEMTQEEADRLLRHIEGFEGEAVMFDFENLYYLNIHVPFDFDEAFNFHYARIA